MTRLTLAALTLLTLSSATSAQTPEDEMQARLAENEARIAEAQAAMEAQLGGIAARFATFDPDVGPGYPALDYNSVPLPPAVVYTSALEEVRIDETNGRFDITDFVVVFAPKRDVEGNAVDHTQQLRGRVLVKDAGGTVVMDRYYTGGNDANPTSNRFETAAHQVNQRPIAAPGTNLLYLTDAGSYAAEFYLDDRLISRVPFNVLVIGSNDPYSNAPPRYALEGDWQTMGWADFHQITTTAEPQFQWNWYDQLLSDEYVRQDYDAVFELRKDGQLLGRRVVESSGRTPSREVMGQTFEHVQRSRGNQGGTVGAMVLESDITDGDYEVIMRVTANAQNGGNWTRTARFSVQGGEFVLEGDQVRGGTAPEDFVEGMNRSFVYPFPVSR